MTYPIQNTSETRIIAELFGKLRSAESQSGPRDAAAEAQINAALREQPAAPYYMAQALVIQEQALLALQQRIQDLEQEVANRPASGGFLGGLFGVPKPSPAPTVGANRLLGGSGQGLAPNNASAFNANSGARGGFLGSAVQTAVAVAGGVMLANVLTGLFASDEAQAADTGWAEPGDAHAEDDYGSDDGGGDFGGFDDF